MTGAHKSQFDIQTKKLSTNTAKHINHLHQNRILNQNKSYHKPPCLFTKEKTELPTNPPIVTDQVVAK